MSVTMRMITSEVEDERRAQNAKWGDVTGQDSQMPIGGSDRQDARALRDYFQRVVDEKAATGTLTWMDILREEFLELAAEPDSNWPAQRREAIQVAAVAVAMVEAGDLRARAEEAKDPERDCEGEV